MRRCGFTKGLCVVPLSVNQQTQNVCVMSKMSFQPKISSQDRLSNHFSQIPLNLPAHTKRQYVFSITLDVLQLAPNSCCSHTALIVDARQHAFLRTDLMLDRCDVCRKRFSRSWPSLPGLKLGLIPSCQQLHHSEGCSYQLLQET